jgi:hypothetical protein
MDSAKRVSEIDDEQVHDWTRPGEALPKTLDPVITMELVQQYVETERNRSRRILLWISLIFLFTVCLILTMFVSIGMFVLKNSKQTTEIVADMELTTAGYASDVVDMSTRIRDVENVKADIEGMVTEKERERVAQKKVLQSDLQRFSKWVSKQDQEGAELMTSLESRLAEIEVTSTEREKELSDVKSKYRGLLESISARPADLSGDIVSKMGPTTGLSNKGGVSVKPVGETMDPIESSEVAKTGDGNVVSSGDDKRSVQSEVLVPPTRSHGMVSVVTFPNGDTYRGGFKDGLFHGWGEFSDHNGDAYAGYYSEDKKHGKGTMTYANGDRYVGSFKHDLQTGDGVLHFQSGDIYRGQFENNMISGRGSMTYEQGNKYEGEFVNGMRHGNGVLTFKNGDVYKGEFLRDGRSGWGTYIFTDGSRYEGGFKDGKRHGRGRYIYPGGEVFEGEYLNGKKEGVGQCIYPNGARLKGVWKNDKLVETLENSAVSS